MVARGRLAAILASCRLTSSLTGTEEHGHPMFHGRHPSHGPAVHRLYEISSCLHVRRSDRMTWMLVSVTCSLKAKCYLPIRQAEWNMLAQRYPSSPIDLEKQRYDLSKHVAQCRPDKNKVLCYTYPVSLAMPSSTSKLVILGQFLIASAKSLKNPAALVHCDN